MKYNLLGSTGLIVSRLALGTMTFGNAYGPIAKVDQQAATELVARALDKGVNFFDTANHYSHGQAEELLGRALGSRRGDVIVATKGGLRMSDNLLDAGLSARNIIAAAEASLRRLNTDYIDLYQIHQPDPHTPFEETLRALDNLVQRGLVRYIGLCNLSAWKVALMLGMQREHRYAPFVSAQMYYSLLGRDVEQEIVPLVQHTGLALLPWSPLAGGFLSGKYTRQSTASQNDRLASHTFPPVDRELGYKVVEKLQEIASRHGATVAQIALFWLLQKPAVTSVIIGASSQKQLDENLAAIDLEVQSSALQELDTMTKPQAYYPNWMLELFPDTPVEQALRG